MRAPRAIKLRSFLIVEYVISGGKNYELPQNILLLTKVIREKSRSEGFLIEQDTIENVSEPNFSF